jgi:broad specificity phosphatase PhoE
VYGDRQLTAEMLPEGIPAIKRLSEYVKGIESTQNLRSELLRCKQTVEIVTKITGKEFTEEPLLNEFMEASFEEFHKRMDTLISKLEGQENQTYLICTHGDVIAAFRYFLTQNEFLIEDHTDYPRPGTLAIIKGGEYELMDFN